MAQGARAVFVSAQKGDRDARLLLDEAAEALAQKVIFVARRLKMARPEVALAGGLFENQPDYVKRFQRALSRKNPQARAFLLTVPGVIGRGPVGGAVQGFRSASGGGKSEGHRRASPAEGICAGLDGAA